MKEIISAFMFVAIYIGVISIIVGVSIGVSYISSFKAFPKMIKLKDIARDVIAPIISGLVIIASCIIAWKIGVW